jgi:hypothetical protein
MEQKNPYRKSNALSGSQEIPDLVRNWKINYRAYNSPPGYPIVRVRHIGSFQLFYTPVNVSSSQLVSSLQVLQLKLCLNLSQLILLDVHSFVICEGPQYAIMQMFSASCTSSVLVQMFS